MTTLVRMSLSGKARKTVNELDIDWGTKTNIWKTLAEIENDYTLSIIQYKNQINSVVEAAKSI